MKARRNGHGKFTVRHLLRERHRSVWVRKTPVEGLAAAAVAVAEQPNVPEVAADTSHDAQVA